MEIDHITYDRGSEWRQWDLHVHTPASFHWTGSRFNNDPSSTHNTELVDEMIAALNAAKPAVFALLDYWSFDGWLALKKRLSQEGSPRLTKTVFPGIELRLAAPTKCRLNAHVLFSDKVGDQVLHDFISALKVEIISRPLSNASLIALARDVGVDKLRLHGFSKTDVDTDDQLALQAGSTIAEINCESYIQAIEKVPKNQAVGFMPYDTSDGLAEVKWQDHYAYFLSLFKTSPIFESRNTDLRGAFVNEETPGNKDWIHNFQRGLNNIPRLCVSGSDAHRFIGKKGDNNIRGYGDFPSGKATWIKADPTFLGLLQAILEPAKRSFVGERPPKLSEVDENKTFFIDSISIKKNSTATNVGTWLDGCNLPLNPDLIAIIGNKGSGKSALADVIALLGYSQQKAHFSFLKKGRFKGKSGEPAKHFEGKLTWCDSKSVELNLNDDPPGDKVELVRYIPQGHFEELCNSHVSRRSDAFEKELRKVIFSHAGESVRLGSHDFDQLIERQESSYRDQLSEFRKDLNKLNQEIARIEHQLMPEVKRSLQEQLAVKNHQIDEHKKIIPKSEDKPSDKLTKEQKEAADSLEVILEKLKEIDKQTVKNDNKGSLLAGKNKAIKNLRERMRLLERYHSQFQEDSEKELETLNLKISDLVTFSSDDTPLDKLNESVRNEMVALETTMEEASLQKEKLRIEQAKLNEKLNHPQLLYQKSLKALKVWNTKLDELIGLPASPETQQGLNARINQLDSLPQTHSELIEQRIKLTGEIFDILDEQRSAREELFKLCKT